MTRYIVTGRDSWKARTDGYQHTCRVPGPIADDTPRIPLGWVALAVGVFFVGGALL